MTHLLAILREAYGLVVDDASLAVASLLWIGLVWLLASHGWLSSAAGGVALAIGLALILVENVLRRARH